MTRRVLVIGLDGATWNLLDPWIEEGELPNLRKLILNGVSGDLESSIPSTTFPAWKCYSTGKKPEKFGIYSFVGVDLKNKKIVIHDSTSCKSEELWDHMGKKGLRVGVVNMPTTFPPKKVNGFMVCGPFSTKGYTFPKKLERELEENYGYKIISNYHLTRDKDIGSVIRTMKSRFDFVKDALRKENLDFLHLTIFSTDTVQHFLWDSKEVKCVWKHVDEYLGDLLDSLNEKFTCIIMSDHGFTRLKARFCLDTWLEKKGYLKMKPNLVFRGMLTALDSLGLSSDILYSILRKLKVFRMLSKVLPTGMRIKLARYVSRIGMRKLKGMESKIDWNHSNVIPCLSLLYLNPDRPESRKIKKKLPKELSKVKNPKNGEQIIKRVYSKEEIYSETNLPMAPDLVLVPKEGYHISNLVGKNVIVDSWEGGWVGTHEQKGIFIAYGSNIKEDAKIEGAKIVDLAPTILHMMRLPVPKDMDGKVLKEIFKEGSDPARRAVKYEDYEETIGERDTRFISRKEEIKERLRKLGYLG
ncbi:MAG: alkaline phosphatase family protein [Candidatus Heimdallarchaeota archaeon]